MISFKDFDESKLYDYTSENLRMFINEIEMKKSVIQEKCASEMAELLKDEHFDTFSSSGQRKMAKVAKKYTGPLMGADEYLNIIQSELAKREQLEEEMRYSGRSKKPKEVSQEEFLQKEQDKTWAYRSKIE